MFVRWTTEVLSTFCMEEALTDITLLDGAKKERGSQTTEMREAAERKRSDRVLPQGVAAETIVPMALRRLCPNLTYLGSPHPVDWC